jgi:hypothetical protein
VCVWEYESLDSRMRRRSKNEKTQGVKPLCRCVCVCARMGCFSLGSIIGKLLLRHGQCVGGRSRCMERVFTRAHLCVCVCVYFQAFPSSEARMVFFFLVIVTTRIHPPTIEQRKENTSVLCTSTYQCRFPVVPFVMWLCVCVSACV